MWSHQKEEQGSPGSPKSTFWVLMRGLGLKSRQEVGIAEQP